MAASTSFSTRVVQILMAGAAYLALGVLGLSLAIPPGYASPIFPAAGLSIAVLLVTGCRAWPGIALGSLILNLTAGSGSTTQIVAAGLIAAGSTLQGVAAAWMVQKISGNRWREMETPMDIMIILAIAGPLGSLTSASIGAGTLYLTGIAGADGILFTWWNWWAGDTLGVLVAMPLTLAVMLRSRAAWRDRRMALGLPMLTALAVIATAYVAVSRYESSQLELSLRNQGEQLAKRLEQRFIAHEEALAALKRLIEVIPEMNFAQFEYFTRITLKENPDIFALSFNPYVQLARRADFERHMAVANDKPDFEIKERDAQKRLVRAMDRADYVAVGYIAPLKGNRPALGFDINSEPIRQDAIRRARQAQTLSVTSTIQLVQENQKRVGALLLYPAYSGKQGDGQQNGDHNLIGFAVGVIKLDEMVQIATAKLLAPGIAFALHDITGGGRDLVYRSAEQTEAAGQGAHLRLPLSVADRTWELSVYATDAYRSEHRPWFAWLTGVVGLLLAALLQALLLVTTGQAAAAQRNVIKQNARLETQGAELRDRTALINTLFDLSPDGFVAFGPDGGIRFANPAFHALTGIIPDEIHNHTIQTLNRYLQGAAEHPEQFVPIQTLFADNQAGARRERITLVRPRHAVLELTVVRGVGAQIDQFAYLRDVTHEAEVDRMKSEFLSHAAHELRTPMASIYGFSELLLTEEFDEETRKDLLQTIHKQTAWLVEIINELLDLARIEARRGRDFEIAAVDLPGVVDEVLGAMPIDMARWPLHIDLSAQISSVVADRAKLRQAITNVIGNAVKYSPEGGPIELTLVSRQDGARTLVGLSVRDSGIGMTAAQATRVGERFYRADTSGSIPGSGLGMAIVKEILELLGGRLEVASEPARGTVVTLWLPALGTRE